MEVDVITIIGLRATLAAIIGIKLTNYFLIATLTKILGTLLRDVGGKRTIGLLKA